MAWRTGRTSKLSGWALGVMLRCAVAMPWRCAAPRSQGSWPAWALNSLQRPTGKTFNTGAFTIQSWKTRSTRQPVFYCFKLDASAMFHILSSAARTCWVRCYVSDEQWAQLWRRRILFHHLASAWPWFPSERLMSNTLMPLEPALLLSFARGWYRASTFAKPGKASIQHQGENVLCIAAAVNLHRFE